MIDNINATLTLLQFEQVGINWGNAVRLASGLRIARQQRKVSVYFTSQRLVFLLTFI